MIDATAPRSSSAGPVVQHLFIGGQWVPGLSNRQFEVHDPATGDVVAVVADAGTHEARAAVDAAAAAQPSWATTPPRDRSEILSRTWGLVLAHRDELASLITTETGKPLRDSQAEVAYGSEFLRWFAEEAVGISGRYATTPDGRGRMTVLSRPVGPCYLITPWNFPLAMATRKIAPALAAGCTVIIKPAELTPLATLFLAQLFKGAGLPDGVLNVLTTTDPAEVSSGVIDDPRLRKLAFTGSTAVGVQLLRQAAGGVLRTSRELGGNAPFLIFEDAHLPSAVDGAMAAKFRNVGQACTAANRFLVHESVAEEFAVAMAARVNELSTGPRTQEGVDIGPFINARAVEKVERLVDDAEQRGARVIAGGTRPEGPGSFFPPTVLTDVPAHADIAHEEIFGPVVSIVPFATEAEAVERANATPFGLVAYVYTNDMARSQRLMESLETGMMGLNTGVVSNAAAPFGGVKHSGNGREGGAEGIQEYLEMKYVLSPDPFAETA